MFSIPAIIAIILALLAVATYVMGIIKDGIDWLIAAVCITIFFAGYTAGMIAVSIL